MERLRTARRYLRACGHPKKIDELQFFEFDKNGPNDFTTIENWLRQGHSVGVISESGMPGIADPGSELVSWAHGKGIPVRPLVGPSSIPLALAASGLNGQNFCFSGYLPIKENDLKKKLESLESQIFKNNQTQVFIETPYRNDRMLKMLKTYLNKNIKLCIARDVTGQDELIMCKKIGQWLNEKITIGKYPCVFLLGK
ncbi:MAG: SAM-dependent methyltransferase [Saprospiraceae bacterium]|nr:SAM-dependent methyltransferase [Bacteroidia bacterium]MBT8228904.1 SAM-dependent methyltransferase [Bacteroidia bacterium]NNF23069.1 SAM-dependent methyltransferase [Saprospiraceae bacterium]